MQPQPSDYSWANMMTQIQEATREREAKAKSYWKAVTNHCTTLEYLRARGAYEKARDRVTTLECQADSMFVMGMEA